MIIPVRCFTCGKVIADKWDQFRADVAKGEDPAVVLDRLNVKRYCCRRIFLSHVDLVEDVLQFSVSANEEGKI
jgi:DNA-directed RNA polymerase subunit N